MTDDSSSSDNSKRKELHSTVTTTDGVFDARIVELVRSLGRKAAEDDFREELRRQSTVQTRIE